MRPLHLKAPDWNYVSGKAISDIEAKAEARGASRERRAILRLLRKHWDDGDQGWVDFERSVVARAKPKRGKR